MEEHVIVDSSFSASINAPMETIDLPAWCFGLPDAEYQACSPAHVATGATTARDGRRMAINVEVIGGVPMVQHFVETVAEKPHLVLKSVSDLFTPAGRTKINVMWELSVKPLGAGRCELTNRVRTWATPEAPVFALDHSCFAFGSGASRTLFALSRISAMSSELKWATGVSARKFRLPAEAVISSVQPAMSAAAASHFARMPT